MSEKKHTFIIAEVGNTHEGSLGLAKQFIRAAADCGVDAVKFQTHIFEAESLPSAPNPPYLKDETRKVYFERTAFTLAQWKELKRFCEEDCQVEFLSSPFSLEAVDLLESVGVRTYKIPSGEVSNIPLLEKIGRTGKKVLLSSGMSSWEELDAAVETLTGNGCHDLVILQCVSEYPCPPQESGLNLMVEMHKRYNTVVGYSDHTLGVAIPLAAAVLGAEVIEKHFTLSKLMYGSDAKNSTEPAEFKYMVEQIRMIDTALSSRIDKDEKVRTLGHMKTTFEKSIVAANNLEQGRVLVFEDFAFKKPGDGIPAKDYRKLIGKKLKYPISKNHPFTFNDFID